MSRLHFFEFGALFYISSTLEHFSWLLSRIWALPVIEGPNACDHMAFCALNSFLKEVNEAAWLHKCRTGVKQIWRIGLPAPLVARSNRFSIIITRWYADFFCDILIQPTTHEYVVAQFFPQFKFIYLLFWGIVMYGNYELRKKIEPTINASANHEIIETVLDSWLA